MLGVRPVEPGYKTWLLEPQPGDLSWAKGRVPTPYGPIGVAWQKGANAFNLTAWVPADTQATVGVPASGLNALLRDNGQAVTAVSASQEPNGRPGYLYLQNLGSGAHLIQVIGGGE